MLWVAKARKESAPMPAGDRPGGGKKGGKDEGKGGKSGAGG